MLRNYLKIAFRNLVRNKVYSFINIGGLAMGITAFLDRKSTRLNSSHVD